LRDKEWLRNDARKGFGQGKARQKKDKGKRPQVSVFFFEDKASQKITKTKAKRPSLGLFFEDKASQKQRKQRQRQRQRDQVLVFSRKAIQVEDENEKDTDFEAFENDVKNSDFISIYKIKYFCIDTTTSAEGR
jgi:hypothetical protein